MKKFLIVSLLLILIVTFSTEIYSQSKAYKPETYFGLNGGSTFSMVNFLPAVPQTYLSGLHGGLVFRHNSQKSLGMQAELNYSQRGWQEEDGYARRIDYLEIPFMSHFHFGRAFQFYVNIGPKVSIKIGDKVLTPLSSVDNGVQYGALTIPLDYGFCGGLGFQLKTGKQVFVIDGRINFSTATIFPGQMTDHFKNSNHMNASISAAWLFKTN